MLLVHQTIREWNLQIAKNYIKFLWKGAEKRQARLDADGKKTPSEWSILPCLFPSVCPIQSRSSSVRSSVSVQREFLVVFAREKNNSDFFVFSIVPYIEPKPAKDANESERRTHPTTQPQIGTKRINGAEFSHVCSTFDVLHIPLCCPHAAALYGDKRVA